MSHNRIIEILKRSESNSIFSYEKIWKNPVPLSEKYRTYLSPDSNAYHSCINPLFSFELEENGFKSFRIFSHLSLRDGVYPLLRYFSLNPVPHEIDPVLIVDEKLSGLVPSAWRERVWLREVFIETTKEENLQELVLLISPDKDSSPLDIVERELLKIKKQSLSFKKILIYFSSCNFMGEEDADYDFSWGYKIHNCLLRTFSGQEVEIIDYQEYQRRNFSKSAFFFLNPLSFYFSDSYILHDLLQRGAVPLIKTAKKKAGDEFVNVSINHGFILHQRFNEKTHVMTPFLGEKVFKNTIYTPAMDDDFTNLKLSTKDFKDWALMVSREIYREMYREIHDAN